MADTTWQTVAVLVDPVRRALYEHVRAQRRPVTREEAADAVAISRNLTAFHLDKLVEAGLLRARYEAPPDLPRGRGRTPKVYEAVEESVALTIPPRQYELVGEILADAVATTPGDARRAASQRALVVGRELAAASGVEAGGAADVDAVLRMLDELGFEPVIEDGQIALRNCPFHRLAQRQPELVCGLNEEFLRGVLDGLGTSALSARLAPRPGHCCVAIGGAGGDRG
jgi:predicted ArsR family transcriptional regulator